HTHEPGKLAGRHGVRARYSGRALAQGSFEPGVCGIDQRSPAAKIRPQPGDFPQRFGTAPLVQGSEIELADKSVYRARDNNRDASIRWTRHSDFPPPRRAETYHPRIWHPAH